MEALMLVVGSGKRFSYAFYVQIWYLTDVTCSVCNGLLSILSKIQRLGGQVMFTWGQIWVFGTTIFQTEPLWMDIDICLCYEWLGITTHQRVQV
jgi:hypothetical protein